MGKPKKQEEESSVEGAPLWIISFADMMSLLMAFFVMLSTFSTFGPKEEQELKGVMKAALAPSGGWLASPPKTGMGIRTKVTGQTPQGSEKPTLEQGFNTDTMVETGPKDFRTQKIFVAESSKIFWSGGVTFSKQGKDYLNTMAAYISKIPCRIIVCESGSGSAELGLNRAIVISEYLAGRGIDRRNLNVSTEPMSSKQSGRFGARKVEIMLLDEAAYKQ